MTTVFFLSNTLFFTKKKVRVKIGLFSRTLPNTAIADTRLKF